jgi:hypothetical protein
LFEESEFVFGEEIHKELMALLDGLDKIVQLQRWPRESDVAQARLHECETRILRIKDMMKAGLSQNGWRSHFAIKRHKG